MSCTAATHDLMRAKVSLFEACTNGRQEWAGLLTGQCNNCASTLALPLCCLCGAACPSTDALDWNEADGTVAHFGCVARVMAASSGTRFVIVAGKTTAREFMRSGEFA